MTKRITKGQRVRYRHLGKEARGVIVHVEDPLVWVRPDRTHAAGPGNFFHGLDLLSVREVHVITGQFGTADKPDREPSRKDLQALSEGPSDAAVRQVRLEQVRKLNFGDEHCIGERPACVSCQSQACVEDPKRCTAI